MTHKTVYRVFFTSQGKAYELYARHIEQADMQGFIAVSGLLFGELSTVLHNPAEESLKKEFEGVERIYLPFHQISRIDEVEKEGRAKIVTMEAGEETASSSLLPRP